jgi:hypothetical protein
MFLEKRKINSIISLWFDPGGCVAQYAMAEQGISILAFQARSMQEAETLKAHELAEEKTHQGVTRNPSSLHKQQCVFLRLPTRMSSQTLQHFVPSCGRFLETTAIIIKNS